MGEEPTRRENRRDQPVAGEPSGKTQTRRARLVALLDRHLSKRWLAVLLGISLLGHGLGLAAYRLHARPGGKGVTNQEISLGAYRFAPQQTEGGPVASAEFSIHIALLEDVDPLARRLLTQRRYRVQEAVETLLRKAHGGDFRDPGLAELKRQLQERVNEALGMRAIADVIITDLDVEYVPERPSATVAASEGGP
jgi:flagellar basal body-associated protein FliL